MTALSRRVFLQSSVVVVAAGAAAACTAPPAPIAPTPTISGTAADPPRGADGSSARRELVSSYGPNGTHYPDDLPWPGETAATELVAECDWTDIARKIESLDADEVAGGAVIRVRPGVLSGGGSGSSARPVLSGVGDLAWTRNVLIVPLEGVGSVTLTAVGIRFDQCARLAFFGLLSTGGVVMTRCASMQIGWGRFDSLNITRGGTDVALYELVLGFRQNSDDTSGIRPTETYAMTNITRIGCVSGPSVKPADSSAHCDTIQAEGTGTGAFEALVSEDCVDYGSSNAAELLDDRLSFAEYRHCLILGGRLPWEVYPLKPGDYDGEPNAFAGNCSDVRLYDSVVAGAIGRMGFSTVQNTRLSYSPAASQQPSASGSWDVDTGISSWSRADIMAEQSVPDYEVPTLRGIWTW